MAAGDALFFASKGFRGFRGVFAFLSPKLEAYWTARWLVDSDDGPWKGVVPDALVKGPHGDEHPLVCAFITSAGQLWRLRSRAPGWSGRKWRLERVVRGTPQYDEVSGFLNASSMGGL